MRTLANPTINTHFNDFDIKITESAYAICDSKWYQRDEHIPTSRMYYIISGSAEIWSDKQKFTLKPGYLYFVPFDSPFSCQCDNKMEKLFFHVNIPFLGKLDLFENFGKIISYPCPHIDEMFSLYRKKDIECIVKLKALLYKDIAHIISLGQYNANIPTYSSIINEAISYINSHISSSLKVSDVAYEISVSKSKLSALFTSEVGISIGKYISNELITKIKLCLINTNLSTNEISEKFEFCDQSYFIRFFKNKTGISPAKFKKKLSFNDMKTIIEDI